jgi:hypothetical protein
VRTSIARLILLVSTLAADKTTTTRERRRFKTLKEFSGATGPDDAQRAGRL